MTYNLSRRSVERLLPSLKKLYEEQQTIKFKTDNPRRLAYMLREAIAASRRHKEYSKYYKLRLMYRFREEPDAVVAEFTGVHVEPEKVAQVKPQQSGEVKEIEGIRDLPEVIAAAVRFRDALELYFPDARLTREGKLKLYEWSRQTGWAYIDQEDVGLTLTHRQVDSYLLWSPEDS